MLIKFDNGGAFARGGAGYNATPDYELSDHIILQVEVGEQTEYFGMWAAVVHTGAPYLICSPEIARAAGIVNAEPDAVGRIPIEGKMIEGKIYAEVNLVLLADGGKGDSVSQPVWAFVPDRSEDIARSDFPEILLGFGRCLDTFLFAVDSQGQTFYFG